MSTKVQKQFGASLARHRRRWQAGLALCALLRLGWWTLTGVVALCVLDYFLAMVPLTRMILGSTTALFLGGALVAWLARALRRRDADMARRADRQLAGGRQTVLSALELSRWLDLTQAPSESLGHFLAGRSIARAAEALGALRPKQVLPVEKMRAESKLLVLVAALCAIMAAANPRAASTLTQRLFLPGRDVPPFSSFVFSVDPREPKVTYGGTVEMNVDIGGSPVRSQVYCLVRYRSKVHRMSCFQASPEKFTQRLEQVVSPVKFCFATGKARSKWHQVSVLLEPQIAVAAAVITPPAYSGRPAERFFVGNQEFAGLRRSKAELSVTSNRPLLDGHVALRRRDGSGEERVVRGEKTGPRTLRFAWEMQHDADVAVTVRDVRGAANREPFVIRQAMITDEPPEAVITRPTAFALATPSVALPVEGYVSDDLGVGRVELVRTVVGYRDRARRLGPEHVARRFDMADTLALADLGVEPGQTLEFYLEAYDLNPTLTGVSASDIVRVQIISDEEYAVMLRARTTIEEFTQRYRAIEAQMEKIREALAALEEAGPTATPESVKPHLDRALDAVKRGAEFYEQLSQDFAAFDLEKALSDPLRDMAGLLRQGAAGLKAAAGSPPRLGYRAGELLDKLSVPETELAQTVVDAELAARIAAVMECAVRYRTLVQRQRELVKRLQRYETPSARADERLLELLGERQEAIRSEVIQLRDDLREKAPEVSNECPMLYISAVEFADVMDAMEIADFMLKAGDAALNEKGQDAHHNATLALERMEQLLSEQGDSPFGSMAGGGQDMQFRIPEDLKSTLQQLLAGMAMRMGGGMGGQPGMGGVGPAGAGIGGSGDGYFMQGNSPLNVPVHGPNRMHFASPSEARMTGVGGRRADGTPIRVGAGASDVVEGAGEAGIGTRSMPVEDIPEKYREAVKRYFGD